MCKDHRDLTGNVIQWYMNPTQGLAIDGWDGLCDLLGAHMEHDAVGRERGRGVGHEVAGYVAGPLWFRELCSVGEMRSFDRFWIR